MDGMHPFNLDPAKPDGPTWLEGQGHSVVQRDGTFYASTPDAEALIAGYDSLGAARERTKGRISDEARERIYGRVASDTVQRNSLARTSEILLLIMQGTATDADRDELVAIRGLWGRIKALRDASNAIEADIDALDDWYAVDGFDAAASPRWPE